MQLKIQNIKYFIDKLRINVHNPRVSKRLGRLLHPQGSPGRHLTLKPANQPEPSLITKPVLQQPVHPVPLLTFLHLPHNIGLVPNDYWRGMLR
jgi:hypothetical protein